MVNIETENIHIQNSQFPYSYLEQILWGLKQLADLPPMGPTAKIKEKYYPGLNKESRNIYVKVIPNNILYLVEDCGMYRKDKIARPINYKGYLLQVSNKELLSAKVEMLADRMDIKIGKDLIEDSKNL
jgi:hypothetical protein